MSEMNLEEKLCKNLEESCIKAYKAGQQSQQAEIDRLNSVLDERTKEWLQAIECGAYFENVAKPLKEENDRLKVQLNYMEACYIQVKKERDDAVYLKDEHRVARVRLSRERDILKKRIDAGLEKIHQFGKEGCLFPEWLTWAEKALRGASD